MKGLQRREQGRDGRGAAKRREMDGGGRWDGDNSVYGVRCTGLAKQMEGLVWAVGSWGCVSRGT